VKKLKVESHTKDCPIITHLLKSRRLLTP